MTVKEAWELYNEINNKVERAHTLMKQITIRHDEGPRSPLGCYEIYPNEMNEIRKVIDDYCYLIEERKNELI